MHKFKPRERITIGVGVVALLALLLAWEVYFRENSRWKQYQAARAQVGAREETLQKMVRFQRQYEQLQSEVDRIRSSMLPREKGAAIQGFLEKTASEKIPSAELVRMGIRTSTIKDLFRETQVVMALEGVSLPEMVEFVFALENYELNLKVKGLKVDLNKRSSDLLDVEFTVSAISDLSD